MISGIKNHKTELLGQILTSNFFQRSRVADDFHVKILNTDYWQWVVNTYDDFLQDNKTKEIVPKIIHQVWIGSKVPKKYDHWRESWQRLNPDYEYILWDEKKILETGLHNEKQFLQAKNPAIKSDLARYELLYKFGGIYADTDFEALKPINVKFLTRSFIAGQIFHYAPQASNGLMIAAPNSKILRIVIESLPEYPGEMSPMEVLHYCGSFYLSKLIWKHREQLEDIVIMPSQYFYPWPNFMIHSSHDLYSWATNETVAIHHWEMSWMKRSFASRVVSKLRGYKV